MGVENYVEGIFSELSEITKNFKFFYYNEGPEGETREEQHRRRMLALIKTVRKMALKRFMQMPALFRAVHDDDDWIQEAMVVLDSESRRYKPEDGYFYDKYMIGIISLRLTSLQRSVFRKNPLVDEDLRKFIGAKRRELGKELTAEEISDITGVTPEHARRALSEGVGAKRRVARESEGMDLNELSGPI